MTSPLNHASLLLVQFLFDFFLTMVLLRLLLQSVRANFYNPIGQFIIRVTDPVLTPLRRFIPSISGVDMASIILLFVTELLKLLFMHIISYHNVPYPAGLLIWTIGDLLRALINVFFYAILLQMILSWISPDPRQPLTQLLYRLTEPLLALARRYVRPIGGIDISPVPVMLILQLALILLANPLSNFGAMMALSLP